MAMVNGNHGAVSQINVTPLIDVLLVLLIIFMVVVPKAPSGLRTMAPADSTDKGGKTDPSTVVVQVIAHGTAPASYKINQDDYAKTEIEPKLAAIFAARQEKLMFVKGDTDLTYDQVAEVIDMGHHVGIKDVGILTPAMSR